MAYKYEFFPKNGDQADDIDLTFTDTPPAAWKGYSRRIDKSMLQDVLSHFKSPPVVYVCGPTPMVEAVAQSLVSLKQNPDDIRAERFGSTS